MRVASSTGFRLQRVRVVFGATTALDAVDLQIEPGEAVALVGPSGAGKTTTLRLLNGTLRPTEGRVLADGRDLSTLSSRELRALRARIGSVHQELSLVPNLRVLANVLTGRIGQQSLLGSLRSLGLPRRAELRRVHELLQRVGIGEKLYERTDRLSGGQRQRVAIARALYQEPKALLADEPVSSVDPARARDTIALLCDVSRERGLTLCMSLHNLDLAREFFPRLVGLRRGRIWFDRPAESIGGAEFDALYDLDQAESIEDAG